jgi:hypothetical protein
LVVWDQEELTGGDQRDLAKTRSKRRQGKQNLVGVSESRRISWETETGMGSLERCSLAGMRSLE